MKRSQHKFLPEISLWHGIQKPGFLIKVVVQIYKLSPKPGFLDSPKSGRHQRKSHKIKAGQKIFIFSPLFSLNIAC